MVSLHTVLEAEKSNIKTPTDLVLLSLCILPCGGIHSHMAGEEKEEETLSSPFLQGIKAISEASTCMINPLPKAAPPNTIVFGLGFHI